MNQARNPEWVRALFRYQHQLRTGGGREITAKDLAVLTAVAALVICGTKPSPDTIAAECHTTKEAVWRCLRKLASMGLVLPHNAWWTTAAPATWQGYGAHARDPSGIERQVAEFLRDLEVRILDLQRRLPKKRMA